MYRIMCKEAYTKIVLFMTLGVNGFGVWGGGGGGLHWLYSEYALYPWSLLQYTYTVNFLASIKYQNR